MRLKMRVLLILLGLIAAAAVTSRGDELADTSLVDTLYLDSVDAVDQFGGVVVPIRFSIDQPLGGLNVSLLLNSSDLTIDSVSFAGGYLDTLLPKGYEVHDTAVNIYCTPFTGYVPSGSGKLGDLYLSYPTTVAEQFITIDTATLNLHEPFRTQFVDTMSQAYVPQFQPGYINLRQGCCIGISGDVNYDQGDQPDILDLTYLVNFMFKEGPSPPCLTEANVNGVDGDNINISDLIYLVQYMFQNGPQPVTCP